MLAAAFASLTAAHPRVLADMSAALPIFDAAADFDGPSQLRYWLTAMPMLPGCASAIAVLQAASFLGSTAAVLVPVPVPVPVPVAVPVPVPVVVPGVVGVVGLVGVVPPTLVVPDGTSTVDIAFDAPTNNWVVNALVLEPTADERAKNREFHMSVG